MPSSFLEIDPALLTSLSAEEAVQLFARLLWSSAHRHGVAIDAITITTRVDVADGGIDAEIRPNAVRPEQDLLVSGNSFFQIKAGTSSAPWQKGWVRREFLANTRKPSKASLGAAVRDCLEQKGRYVLACFGCNPTGPKRKQAIRLIREMFSSCGFRNARVDVWGQSTLVMLLQQFPSLSLRLSNQHHLPFLRYDEWKLDATMIAPLHLGKSQQQVIDDVCAALRGDKFRHVRLVGEPGLGKTRLALEALSPPDLAPTVLYVRNPEDFERSPLFNALLRSDDPSSATLVIDDCPEKDRASIWNVLRQRSDRIRLVTLDHGPETSHDEWMLVIDCPQLDQAQVEEILAEYIGRSNDLERWASFCSGSPRVAHAVGENLHRNPSDILRPPASVPIWHRFMHGNTRSGSAEQSKHEIVLRHVALFHKLGFEAPVNDEAEFVADLVQRVDPTLTWAQFQSIVKHFRDRRILQGKTTLFLVPRALHIYLWLEYWEHYGTGVDLKDLLKRMPESLFRWFAEMFKYGHVSPKCMSQIEKLTGPGGPFDDASFITDGKGAHFLNELAEAHPRATLRCIERTIGAWSQDDLFHFNNSRQYIVWALEKIAIWSEFFQRAAAVLLKLAAAENATNSNNATGTFCELFDMGFDRMASTEASPPQRMPALKRALSADDPNTRSVGLKALGHALADHPYSKFVGQEHQGLRAVPQLWTPKIWGEVHDAYRAAWQIAREFWRSHSGDEKAAAATVMIDNAHHLVRRRALVQDVIPTLQEMAACTNCDLRPLVRFLSLQRRIRWEGMSRGMAAALRGIEKRIEGSDLVSRLTRAVLLGTWDDMDRDTKGHHRKAHSRKLQTLARQTVASPAVLQQLLPRLITEPGFSLSHYGYLLGEADKGFDLWSVLINAFSSANGPRNPELLTGYLSAMFVRERSRWERNALELLDQDVPRSFARQLVVGSGMTEPVLRRIRDRIEKQEIPDSSLDGVAYGRKRSGVATDRYIEVISWCVGLSRPALIRTALETAYLLFCFEKEDPPRVPEQPLLNLLTADGVFQANREYYEWAELATRFVEAYPKHSMTLLRSVLQRFADHAFVLTLTHSPAQATLIQLIKHDPHASWQVVTGLMSDPRADGTWHLAHWLGPRYTFGDEAVTGPLSAFNLNDVLDWIAESPDERAPLIARECPKTLDPGEGGEITRQILIRYGRQEAVQQALLSNFGSRGTSGRASERFRERREKARRWLARETEMPVIEWIGMYVSDLTAYIKHFEIREERHF